MKKKAGRLLWFAALLAGFGLAALALAQWPAQVEERVIPLPEDCGLSGQLRSGVPAWARARQEAVFSLQVDNDESGAGSPVLEAWLELPGAEVQPQGAWLQPVAAGQKLVFRWQVIPGAGELEGTLWAAVLQGQERQVVLARPVNLTVWGVGMLPPGLLEGLSAALLAAAVGLAVWSRRQS